jgi:hypothetical protein
MAPPRDPYLFASSALMDLISKDFVECLKRFAKQHQISVVPFRKGERKDDIAAEHLKKFKGEAGVLFIGKPRRRPRLARNDHTTRRPGGLTRG